jgi:hypothetical protein
VNTHRNACLQKSFRFKTLSKAKIETACGQSELVRDHEDAATFNGEFRQSALGRSECSRGPAVHRRETAPLLRPSRLARAAFGGRVSRDANLTLSCAAGSPRTPSRITRPRNALSHTGFRLPSRRRDEAPHGPGIPPPPVNARPLPVTSGTSERVTGPSKVIACRFAVSTCPLEAGVVRFAVTRVPLAVAHMPLPVTRVPLAVAHVPLAVADVPLGAATRPLLGERRAPRGGALPRRGAARPPDVGGRPRGGDASPLMGDAVPPGVAASLLDVAPLPLLVAAVPREGTTPPLEVVRLPGGGRPCRLAVAEPSRPFTKRSAEGAPPGSRG